ncbi:hypothetical protein [Natrinema sp. DC36]|uniref:hypothetical protein n=1 Tax=Natrinema sp. DC36 TaxID=2878680 RepID=UPI001CF06699|nr:hypothetical protein [Natrinema sp. DC36]
MVDPIECDGITDYDGAGAKIGSQSCITELFETDQFLLLCMVDVDELKWNLGVRQFSASKQVFGLSAPEQLARLITDRV